MDKPVRSPEQLRAMVQVRLNAVIRSQKPAASDRHPTPIAGIPRKHARDVLGRTRDIDELKDGLGRVAEFRLIVDELRHAYDLG